MSHNTSQITHLDFCLTLPLSLGLPAAHRHAALLCAIQFNISLSPRFLSLSYSPSYLRTTLVKAPYPLRGTSFMTLL